MVSMEKLLIRLIGITAVFVLGTAVVSAFSASSTNYRLDNGALNSFGGDASSTNYRLTDSGGEPFIGAGSSTNYKFNAGYVASLEHSISMTLNATTVTIPAVTAGTSQTATTTATVFTDAAGYTLGIRQDHNLTHTDGSTTISNHTGSIASPTAWVEGTTKGFGFTITGGTSIEAKWGTNPNYNYAGFPTTATTIHAKPGYQNTNDVNTIQYRLDVTAGQIAGTYTNHVTYNAVVTP